ncbi:MAG: hypothetical protein F4Z57_22655 [Gemmatimonadetes bacterium]|nr:hypothetical protein [Gemmatimonadota bacterium]MXW81733.1 hypothetical protein [Gemmatimonadota bacterium]MYC69462.1 hypothetical protein [Gemmatimonadota bacterium]MYI62508.1 hypothetical protein [Gemmatimonadota bacterium]
MNENSRRVLEMLSEGKVSVDEAERLLSLVDEEPEMTPAVQPLVPSQAGSVRRYLRVTVDSDGDEHVDVRVPLALIKAGVKLHTLLPAQATTGINTALQDNGINVDIDNLRTEDLEQLIDALSEIEVNIQDGDDKVRVYCE